MTLDGHPARGDFRVRKSAQGFHVWQHEGARWVRLETVYPSRRDALAAITEFRATELC